MKSRISPSFTNLTKQGQVMVQVLTLSSEAMISEARAARETGDAGNRNRFTERIRHLLSQRSLAGQVLAAELELSDYDHEIATLQWLLEDLCYKAEMAVLRVEALSAKHRGDSNLAKKIDSLLKDLATRRNEGAVDRFPACPSF